MKTISMILNYIYLICSMWVLMIMLSDSVAYCGDDIPWTQRHFHNAPRIEASFAFSLASSGANVMILGTHSNIPYEKSHVCGAIEVKLHQITKINVKKFPRNVTYLCY
jgi:hypothetical protein